MTAERRPYVAGNWKMHKTPSESVAFIRELLPRLPGDGVEIGLCVPYTSLERAVAAVSGSGVRVLAQNMHQQPEGAFTGEISAPMLLELGVNGVVLGHSERRRDFGETDRALQEKLPVAIEAGLQPILCVGESEEERDGDETERRLRHQVQEALERVADERLPDVVIAYEPVWAIGTGRVATPDQAQSAMAFVRALVSDRSRDAGERVRILYGGSVKPDNAAKILAQPDVDGALVGGASLEVESFAALAEAAVEAR
jgi:triosephosphate isomerase (TIM)